MTNIGFFIFDRMDQIDFTGPFEVLSRIPDSALHVIAKEKAPIRDVAGLILTPEKSLAEAPPLDLLVIPGGSGQQELMEDRHLLPFIKQHADSGRYLYSVCTGALLCGAAGVLRGRRATTHWTAFHLLHYFGAVPVQSRVVVDGNCVSSAGVTAGIDGALRIASLLRGEQAAQQIQLGIEYAPDPPFRSGTPETAPPEVLRALIVKYRDLTEAREATAQKIAASLSAGRPSWQTAE